MSYEMQMQMQMQIQIQIQIQIHIHQGKCHMINANVIFIRVGKCHISHTRVLAIYMQPMHPPKQKTLMLKSAFSKPFARIVFGRGKVFFRFERFSFFHCRKVFLFERFSFGEQFILPLPAVTPPLDGDGKIILFPTMVCP